MIRNTRKKLQKIHSHWRLDHDLLKLYKRLRVISYIDWSSSIYLMDKFKEYIETLSSRSDLPEIGNLVRNLKTLCNPQSLGEDGRNLITYIFREGILCVFLLLLCIFFVLLHLSIFFVLLFLCIFASVCIISEILSLYNKISVSLLDYDGTQLILNGHFDLTSNSIEILHSWLNKEIDGRQRNLAGMIRVSESICS